MQPAACSMQHVASLKNGWERKVSERGQDKQKRSTSTEYAESIGERNTSGGTKFKTEPRSRSRSTGLGWETVSHRGVDSWAWRLQGGLRCGDT